MWLPPPPPPWWRNKLITRGEKHVYEPRKHGKLGYDTYDRVEDVM